MLTRYYDQLGLVGLSALLPVNTPLDAQGNELSKGGKLILIAIATIVEADHPRKVLEGDTTARVIPSKIITKVSGLGSTTYKRSIPELKKLGIVHAIRFELKNGTRMPNIYQFDEAKLIELAGPINENITLPNGF